MRVRAGLDVCGSRGLGGGWRWGREGGEEGSPRARHDAVLQSHRGALHGIGDERVALDYEHFVTAYTYPIDLFHSSSSKMAVGALRL